MQNIKQGQSIISKIIKSDIDRCSSPEIKEAMLYSMSSGKRLRSLIVGSLNGFNPHFLLFVEYVHNSSLVIDDLPCMDNDQMRRGAETVHVKYGEHIAQLVAYNLMVNATYHLVKGKDLISFDMSDLTEEVNESLNGISRGQLMDLSLTSEFRNRPVREQRESILNMIRLKTGCLFSLSFILGWISREPKGSKSKEDLRVIKEMGYDFGICYQIIDDLCDVEGDKHGMKNICIYFSHNELIDMFTERMTNFGKVMTTFKLWNPTLIELNTYMIEMFKKHIRG